MANEFISQLTPRDFYSENQQGLDDSGNLTRVGDLVGLTMRKNSSYVALVPVSHANTFTTGLTFSLYLVDDGKDSNDLGKVVRIGITPKTIVDAETTDMDTGAATETAVDVTLEATSQNITVNTQAIANAALDSLATGNALALRIRRIGSHANDTCKGTAVLLGVGIKNT